MTDDPKTKARLARILHDQGFRHVAGNYWAKLPEKPRRALRWAEIVSDHVEYLKRKPRCILTY